MDRRDRLRGVRCGTVVAPDYRHRAEVALTQWLLGLGDPSGAELVVLTPTGGRTRVSASCVAVCDQRGAVGVPGVLKPLEEETSTPPAVALPPRQHETLRLLSEGHSTAELARELGVAQETARNYVRGLLRSLRVHSRLEAVVRGRELGLI